MCIIRDENAQVNPDGTYVFTLGRRPFIPATCNMKPQCISVSCPPNTTLFKYGGMNILDSNNETTLEGNIIFNNSCVRKCEEKTGLEMSDTDINCQYFDPITGNVDIISKVFSKPTCLESKTISLSAARNSTGTCTYKSQDSSLAGFKSNMKCPRDYKLETYIKNGVVLPRCIKLINKVNNSCPKGSFETTPSTNKCRQFRNPICISKRETFDRKNGSCLKGSCSSGVLFDKKCYACAAGYTLNQTSLKCEKKGSSNMNPTRTDPKCFKN